MDVEFGFENTPKSPLTVNVDNSKSLDGLENAVSPSSSSASSSLASSSLASSSLASLTSSVNEISNINSDLLPDLSSIQFTKVKNPLNSANLANLKLPLPQNVKPFFSPTPPRSPTPPSAPSDHTLDHWSSDVEHVLDNVRSNADILSTHHKQSYLKLQAQLVYFRVPLIILSALNSVFSVGLSIYIEQQTVSSVNCLISLICACISSVELFLQIQKKLEVELSSYHGYYLLGTRISATLKLERAHREVEGLTFLNNMLSEYNNLFEQSCVDKLDIDDKLVTIELKKR